MKGFAELFQQGKERYEALNGRGRSIFWCAVAGIFLLAAFMFPGKPMGPEQTRKKEPAQEVPLNKEDRGYFLGEDVDHKAYVARLEAQYFAVSEKNQALASRLEDVVRKLDDVAKSGANFTEALAALEQRVNEAAVKMADVKAGAGSAGEEGRASVDTRNYQLEVINVNPVKGRNADMVYLPAGSFVKATLLTGVYAPAEAANPLPVLIRLNEAFYGPNDVRIPLEGAFAIGRATGDLTSERALVQISTLSCVLGTSETFEHKGNIGYLTDAFGQLGLKGVVVRNTGGQLSMSFMTGFMGGASQGLADAQTTTVIGDNGHMERNVTGSRAKNAAFQGFAQSAAQMSKYYEDQLNKIVPAVKVDAGVDVYLIILEGVEIHGLKKDSIPPVRFAD